MGLVENISENCKNKVKSREVFDRFVDEVAIPALAHVNSTVVVDPQSGQEQAALIDNYQEFKNQVVTFANGNIDTKGPEPMQIGRVSPEDTWPDDAQGWGRPHDHQDGQPGGDTPDKVPEKRREV